MGTGALLSGNNPVRYVDPDGRILKVSGNEDFKKEVESSLQEIYPSAVVDMKTGIVSFSDTVKAEGHANGKELLENLINSDNEHKIVETQKGNSASPNKDYKKGEGAGSSVNFNPDKRTGGIDTTGSNVRPPFIGLTHELGHSEAIDNGTQSSKGKDDKTPGTTPLWEENSMKREREVRKEHGLNDRPSYYYAPPAD